MFDILFDKFFRVVVKWNTEMMPQLFCIRNNLAVLVLVCSRPFLLPAHQCEKLLV